MDDPESSTAKIKRVACEAATGSANYERTIRYVISCIALTIILAYNASDFDITEGNTIMLMAVVLGAGEGLPVLMKKLLPTQGPES